MPLLPKRNPYFPSASTAYGESTFICPGNFISQSYAGKSYKVWNYHYNVTSVENIAGGLGTSHTFELPEIFGPGNANDRANASYSSYNAPIVPVVMDYFTSFVRTLYPHKYKAAGAPVWEDFGRERGRLLLQTNAPVMETVPKDQFERCEFWESLGVVMQQ